MQGAVGALAQAAWRAGHGAPAAPAPAAPLATPTPTHADHEAAAEAAANLTKGQDVVFNALQQRFSDVSAVNIDQEMANLLTNEIPKVRGVVRLAPGLALNVLKYESQWAPLL